MPVILSRVAHRFPRRRFLNNQHARAIPAVINGYRPTMMEKISEFGQLNIPKRVMVAVKAIDSAGCDKGDITLFEVHKAEYERLLRCENLKEVKRLFFEFENVKETGGALALLQSIYCGRKFGARPSPKTLAKLQEKLNFPTVNKKYMDYIAKELSARSSAANLSFMA